MVSHNVAIASFTEINIAPQAKMSTMIESLITSKTAYFVNHRAYATTRTVKLAQ